MSTIGYVNVSLEIWGGILSLVVLMCIFIRTKERSRRSRLFVALVLCNIFILLSDASAWLFKGHLNTFSYYGVRISNFFVFALGYVLLLLFTSYITCYLGEKGEVSAVPLRVIKFFCAAAFFLVILSQFNHMFYSIDSQNIYHRENWFWLSQVGGIAGMFVNTGMLVRYRKYLNKIELLALFSYIVLPVAAMTIQIFIYGVALLNLATTMSILLIFLLIQIEQARKLQEKELELADSRVAVMLSQIQPHFIYNVLTAIKQLCDSNPEEAKEAIVEFSVYLRGNLDLLVTKHKILFESELDQVKNYLSLEKKRFGSRLNIKYDIRTEGFQIPPLTVQTIVENAVRHGATKNENGGTVVISAWETEEDYVVTVSDDGPGMNPICPEDGRSHVGMENVKLRLESMCRGQLKVESDPGTGTRVTIYVPKGGDSNAAAGSG